MRDLFKTIGDAIADVMSGGKSDANLEEFVRELGKLRDNVVKAKSSKDKLDVIRAKAKELKDKYFQSKQEGKPEEELQQLAFDFAQEDLNGKSEAKTAAQAMLDSTDSVKTVEDLLGPVQALPAAKTDPAVQQAITDALNSATTAKRVNSEVAELINEAMRWGAQVDRDLAQARAAVAATYPRHDSLFGPSEDDVKRVRDELDAELTGATKPDTSK